MKVGNGRPSQQWMQDLPLAHRFAFATLDSRHAYGQSTPTTDPLAGRPGTARGGNTLAPPALAQRATRAHRQAQQFLHALLPHVGGAGARARLRHGEWPPAAGGGTVSHFHRTAGGGIDVPYAAIDRRSPLVSRPE